MTAAAGATAGGRRTVLIVDDEADLRDIIAEFFTEQGFDVLQAANGLEGLLHVKRARPGFVVLDLAMPRLGGIDALKHIRAFDPRIVVVVVTAMLEPDVERLALERGARAVLRKPVSLTALLATLTGDPAAIPAAPAAAPRPRATDSDAGRLLVVDDDAEVCSLLVDYCRECGYDVHTAHDGAAALQAIADTAPDVVLLDVQMPSMSGVDALPAIRAIAPGVKVIMVSGVSDAALARQALSRGAFDYVAKPIDLAYLRQSVETAVTMKRLEG